MRAIYEPAVKVKHLNSATVRSMLAVSYTHLDVYKRQDLESSPLSYLMMVIHLQ